MPDLKITQMTVASTLDGTEIVPLVQTGTNVQTTTADFVSEVLDVNPVLATQGGTGLTTYTLGDVIYASATNTLAKLAGNTTTTNKFLRQVGTGSVSAAPIWDIIDPSDINTQYGAFSQSTTLTNATPGTGMPMRFDTTDLSNGITIESDGTHPTYIRPAISGFYNFQFSAQLNKNGGGSSAIDVYIWMRLNGVDIPSTNTRITIQGPSSYTVAAWNFFFQATAGDNFQLMWASTDVHAEIDALTPAIGPAIPAIILTVNQVS